MRAKANLSAAALAAALLCACSLNYTVTGGKDPVTQPDNQSETAATVAVVNGKTRLVVSYNDETGQAAKIQYANSTSRLALKGATQMGWSWSDDGGKTWTHGGPLASPQGFSILWGDPAMATSGKNKNVVFLSSLAVPDSKMPPGGISGSLSTFGVLGYPIGGACIAKSTDGGKSFVQWHCVQNTTPAGADQFAANGHFYDGGAMASTPNGAVFAAYNDTETGKIDVWTAPDENGSFTQMANPFPGKTAVLHPRMRVGPNGILYLAAEMLTNNGGVALFMTRFVGGVWTNPVQVAQGSEAGPAVDFGSNVQGSKLTVRTAAQFGFDVGTASAQGNDAVRILETHKSGGRLFLEGTACSANLQTCAVMSGWQLGPSSATPLDLYNPDVVAWWGDKTNEATWQASFMERYGTSVTKVNVSRTTLGYVNGTPLVFPVNITKDVPVCSDTRGYWGDYDGMILVGPAAQGGMSWMRFYTDSASACSKRWVFVAREQHVSQASYDY
ncbi:MAG: hypothetical protein ACJ76N_16945 [Thermoanaerobaculia bacterium]